MLEMPEDADNYAISSYSTPPALGPGPGDVVSSLILSSQEAEATADGFDSNTFPLVTYPVRLPGHHAAERNDHHAHHHSHGPLGGWLRRHHLPHAHRDCESDRTAREGGHHHSGSDSGFAASGHGSNAGVSHSQQHLLAVGSRQWGSGGWWDGRSLLKVKIYDFAVYADPSKALHALQASADRGRGSALRVLPPATTTTTSSCSSFSGCPMALLKSPASEVDMSLTIRASRPLPLHMLSQEFERILQRRTEKAGGRPDDPALAELLSYFTAQRLPRHVVSAAGDAVRKGAAITFSRSSSGELVTAAGGEVLGVLRSAPVVEALFDLYLGDQPVSKKAKAAAVDSLTRMMVAHGAGGGNTSLSDGGYGSYQYLPRPGERLRCANRQDLETCVVEL